ncbi:WGR domain-containing protein [Novosphingobium sp. CECT 9465]|uniref:WGR domain-containing protein n=1 Tax=Novosphingobium sp. CECT 9465 TaxID=2829794 RepID=UPI000BCB05E6|nr:WGR domain-containing protein [Novosphingobium sp. CECT 9465]OYX47400.1 MAG: molybdate metabolism regulator [Sphingomonadales bacterium 32-64-22]
MWLEAKYPALNVARRYVISRSQDLFGVSIVELTWGRIGTRGQGKRLSFADAADAADAEHFIAGLLRRRASATRRIGVPYREVHRT